MPPELNPCYIRVISLLYTEGVCPFPIAGLMNRSECRMNPLSPARFAAVGDLTVSPLNVERRLQIMD